MTVTLMSRIDLLSPPPAPPLVCAGRVYVSDCPPVLSALVQQLRAQDFVDGPIQMNIVGALQKLSLR